MGTSYLHPGNVVIWSKSRVNDKPRPADIHVSPSFRPGARRIGPVHTMPSTVISIMRYEINYTIILLSAIWGLLYLLLKRCSIEYVDGGGAPGTEYIYRRTSLIFYNKGSD